VQLYAIQRENGWGVGDFTTLGDLLAWGAEQGLAYIGVNPLHALHWSKPRAASPYYPSSRLALNPIYIDPDALADHLGVSLPAEFKAALTDENASPLIDYERVGKAKDEALRHIFSESRPEMTGLSEGMKAHALFEAHIEAASREPTFGYRSAAAYHFVRQHTEVCNYHLFLQWAADQQLRAAAARGEGACTLYLDLAVGVAPDGSEIWANPDSYAKTMRLGAPPDLMAPGGQDWGLVPFHPGALAHTKAGSFKAVLKASATYAGALRIDHALGLNRQYFIPTNASADRGAYVAFPQNLLLQTIALVSRDTKCVMVGEDLGTVPEGLTEALHDVSVLSYEVTRWSRDADGQFQKADDYPHLCLAAATTHDIAPVAGWFFGSDLETRVQAGHLSLDDLTAEQEQREEERTGLLTLWGIDKAEDPDTDKIIRAAHGFLASTKAAVTMMALEDLLLQEDMMNLPGTLDQHPNWRRRYSLTFETWSRDPAALRRLKAGLR
jgi:4-alpha-glucanotransferase